MACTLHSPLVPALLVGASLAGQARAATAWWDGRWPWRRHLTVEFRPTRLPGQDVAVVTLPTHGQVRQGGPSIRIFGADGTPRDHFVMQTGPGDRARVCFALKPGLKAYVLYYGNKAAEPPKTTWRPRRGLMLEGWLYQGGRIDSLEHTLRVFERAGRFTGRTFVPNIFLGHNPLGPYRRTCHKLTGYLICPADGIYRFTTSSDDASFLLIDDRLVVSWPGVHAWRADTKYTSSVRLSKGLHKLTYYHVNVGGHGGAVAAWQPPGQARITVIPPEAFAPVFEAKLGSLQRAGRRLLADFLWQHEDEAFVGDRYIYRYRFEAKPPSPDGTFRYVWDFGDGTSASEPAVEHVFLAGGTYPVRLTVHRGRNSATIVNRVYVTRDWNRVIKPQRTDLSLYGRIVARYRLDELRPRDLLGAMALFEALGQADALLRIATALVEHAADLPAEQLVEPVKRIERLLLAGNRPDQVAAVFLRLEQTAKDVQLKALAAAEAGWILLHEADEPDRAAEIFSRVLADYAPQAQGDGVRLARIGMGDVYRRRGRAEAAQRLYHQAGPIETPAPWDVRVGSFARAAEDYIRRKEFDAAREQLREWEWQFPSDKLVGYSSLLWARLFLAQGQPDRAVRVAAELVAVNPSSPHAAELLALAAQACLQQKRPQQAARFFRRIVEDYPESPLCEQARKKLAELAPAASRPAHPPPGRTGTEATRP